MNIIYSDIKIDIPHIICQIQKKNQKINKNRFYAINTICNFLPYLEYEIFDFNMMIKLLESKLPIYTYFFKKIKEEELKYDIFKAYYLFANGGVIIDIDHILLSDISSYLIEKQSFVNNLNNQIDMSFIIVMSMNDPKIFNYLSNILQNIHLKYYGKNITDITGGGCLSKYIDTDNKRFNIVQNKLYGPHIHTINDDKKILLRLNSYEFEKSILDQNNAFCSKKIYNTQIIPEFNKIKFIDMICWLKIDSDLNLNKYIEEQFNLLSIANVGINIASNSDSYNFSSNISKNEKNIIATNLKIYDKLKKLDLETSYCLIVSTEVNFNNLNLFQEDLSQIIRSSPEFDMLILSSPYDYEFNNLYTRLDQNKMLELNQMLELNRKKDILLKKYVPAYVLNIKSLDKIISRSNTSLKKVIYDITLRKNVETSYVVIENMIDFFHSSINIVVYKYDYFGLDYKNINNLIIDKIIKNN